MPRENLHLPGALDIRYEEEGVTGRFEEAGQHDHPFIPEGSKRWQ
jgi:hypothetical protein